MKLINNVTAIRLITFTTLFFLIAFTAFFIFFFTALFFYFTFFTFFIRNRFTAFFYFVNDGLASRYLRGTINNVITHKIIILR